MKNFTKRLEYRDRGYEVYRVQMLLFKLGFFKEHPGSFAPDPDQAFYGPVTAEAVRAYQVARGVDVSTSPAGHHVGPRTLDALNKEVPQSPMRSLVAALIEKESGGDDWAIGDHHISEAEGGKAYGPLQIRRPCITDVNKKNGTKFTAEQCRGNRELSLWVFEEYVGGENSIYGKGKTDEQKARIWNGGPGAWRKHPKPEVEARLQKYWRDVQAILSR